MLILPYNYYKKGRLWSWSAFYGLGLQGVSSAASNSVAAAIEALMRSLEIKGISESTLRAFNEYHQQFDRLNRSLPATNRLADSLVADKLATSVRAGMQACVACKQAGGRTACKHVQHASMCGMQACAACKHVRHASMCGMQVRIGCKYAACECYAGCRCLASVQHANVRHTFGRAACKRAVSCKLLVLAAAAIAASVCAMMRNHAHEMRRAIRGVRDAFGEMSARLT
eukprot:6178912-Pleurochrysis_carterae.AAC.1